MKILTFCHHSTDKKTFIGLNEQITDFAIEICTAHHKKLRKKLKVLKIFEDFCFFLDGLFECILAYRCRALCITYD